MVPESVRSAPTRPAKPRISPERTSKEQSLRTWPLDLREELHERGLAGPFLPGHDMDLARHYLKVHAIDRENPGKLFGDVSEAHDRGSRLGRLRLR
jgi:hypothetical protein